MTHWFIIESGPNTGRPHLSGWLETAFKGEDGWLGYALCPRCHAMVPTHGTYGDQTWRHEEWHAATDLPIPEGLLAEVSALPKEEET